MSIKDGIVFVVSIHHILASWLEDSVSEVPVRRLLGLSPHKIPQRRDDPRGVFSFQIAPGNIFSIDFICLLIVIQTLTLILVCSPKSIEGCRLLEAVRSWSKEMLFAVLVTPGMLDFVCLQFIPRPRKFVFVKIWHHRNISFPIKL